MADFDVGAVYRALDERREERALTWAQVTREINDAFGGTAGPRPISPSTVRGLRDRTVVEGDGVLQMLRWLGRSPESFVPAHPLAGDPETVLPEVGPDRILRWDAGALHRALQEQRTARRLTWADVAAQTGCPAAGLRGLATASRVSFPGVMRIVGWLGRPAAHFVRATTW